MRAASDACRHPIASVRQAPASPCAPATASYRAWRARSGRREAHRAISPAPRRPTRSKTATDPVASARASRSEEHTSELQSLMRTSYAVFCLKKKTKHNKETSPYTQRNKNHTYIIDPQNNTQTTTHRNVTRTYCTIHIRSTTHSST